MRLLARDMDDRPANAQEALREFEQVRHATAPVTSQPIPTKPRLITGLEAESGTQFVTAGPLSGMQPVGGAHTTTHQVPLHTATTTVVADPHTRPIKSKTSSVPPWVYTVGGILMIFIVVLGVATAMRGDPGHPPPPEPAAGGEVAAEPPADPEAQPDPAPAEPSPAATPPVEQPAEPPAKRWNPVAEFKRRDKNADFVVSKSEFVTATTNPRKAELERQFAQLDKNNDDELTMSEFREYRGDKD
jgi:hypothetical protein